MCKSFSPADVRAIRDCVSWWCIVWTVSLLHVNALSCLHGVIGVFSPLLQDRYVTISSQDKAVTLLSSGVTLFFLLQASVCWTWRSSFHFQRLLHPCWPDCWKRLREKVSLNEEVTHFDVQLHSFPLVYNILKHLNLTIFCDLLHRTTCTNISFMSQ